jgi:hypothetical protein
MGMNSRWKGLKAQWQGVSKGVIDIFLKNFVIQSKWTKK